MTKNCNDYIRFRRVKALILDCFNHTVKTRDDYKIICEKSGYRNQEKFLKHLDNWLSLEADIPLGFLGAIGVSNEAIFEKLEEDKTEFENYKSQSLCGAVGVIRIMATIYNRIEIPQKYTERECIAFVAGQLTYHFKFVIHFGGVKSIWVDQSGKETITFYDPDLKLGKAALLIKGAIPVVHYKDDRMFGIGKFMKS